MSINLSGMTATLQGGEVQVLVDSSEPLLKLSNLIDWTALQELVLVDLSKTPKGCSNVGRALHLRIHLGVYILQLIFNGTDRGMWNRLKYDALWQKFCGLGVTDAWHVPHFTKIEEFRNRLSPATHHAISEIALKVAHAQRFTTGKFMDGDSTVQEANMSYPADINIMHKLAKKAFKLTQRVPALEENLSVKLKLISGKVREYVYLAKNTALEKKRKVFAEVHEMVTEQVLPVIQEAMKISEEEIQSFSQRTQDLFMHVCEKGSKLLADVEVFIETKKMVPDKPLCLHLDSVVCINKGKVGKPLEFGRVYQLGRVDGNFLLIAKAKDLRESDKEAWDRLVYHHRRIFGVGTLQSAGADRGYFSAKNIKALRRAGVREIALQMPCNIKNNFIRMEEEDWTRLKNRRAAVEPLIGLAKQGGLGKSRMKSDKSTESSAYRCVMGFNLRQICNRIQREAA